MSFARILLLLFQVVKLFVFMEFTKSTIIDLRFAIADSTINPQQLKN